jgi:hypothetical protein
MADDMIRRYLGMGRTIKSWRCNAAGLGRRAVGDFQGASQGCRGWRKGVPVRASFLAIGDVQRVGEIRKAMVPFGIDVDDEFDAVVGHGCLGYSRGCQRI